MKTRMILLITAVTAVFLMAGVFSADALAEEEEEPTPEDVCLAAIEDLVEAGIDMGSFWEEDLNECWLRTSVEGSTCYPGYEVWFVEYYFIGSVQFWGWGTYGCVARYNRPTDVIRDPSFGFHVINNLSDGTFTYEPRTCEGKCRIRSHGLTLRAEEALVEAPGKVLNKGYIQIFDPYGNLDYGDFTYCLPAKGAKSPAFYRYGAFGQWWPVLETHWEINLFCVDGTMSGNYILVDDAYKPQ